MNPYGNGIGLSLCKKICQSLDGDIIVISLPGHGSEFIFTMKANLSNGEANSNSY